MNSMKWVGIPGAIALVISAIINLIAVNWDNLFPPPDDTAASLGGNVQPEVPSAQPGKWQTLEPGIVYMAESDGYVTAFSSGTGTIEGAILDGPSPDKLSWRTRFLALSGATLPVKDGRYWTVIPVRPERGSVDTIKVQWWGSN